MNAASRTDRRDVTSYIPTDFADSHAFSTVSPLRHTNGIANDIGKEAWRNFSRFAPKSEVSEDDIDEVTKRCGNTESSFQPGSNLNPSSVGRSSVY